MTPTELAEHLENEYKKAEGKTDFYSQRARQRYPAAINLVKSYIAKPDVKEVDPKKWNSPASDPWKSLYD